MSDANIKQLIGRLEALEAPCRECDCLIGVALGWFITEPNKGWPDQLDYIDVRNECWYYPGGGFDQLVPRFTASLDAAMTLVPEGSDWLRKGFSEMSVVLDDPNDKMWARHIDGHHKHPAIALCIAALRAQDALGFEIREKGQ